VLGEVPRHGQGALTGEPGQQVAPGQVEAGLQQQRVAVAEMLVDDPAADVGGRGEVGQRDGRAR
jgi:hypothetical protein